jgi:hypothetical protein
VKRYRGAIDLSIVLLVLVGIAYWDEVQTKKDESAKALENRVFSLNEGEIVRLKFEEPPTAVGFELAKEDGKWRVVSPLSALADEPGVNSFIKTLLEYKFEKLVSESKDKWSDYGVAQPQRIITLVNQAGKTEQIYIGNQAPVGYSAYFRMDESGKVFVGSQYLITSTGRTVQEFRDKSIPAFEAASIKEFRYSVGGELIFAATRANGKVSITEPAGIDTDAVELDSFLSEVSRSKAEDFNDQPEANFEKAFESATAAFAMTWVSESGEQGGWRVAAVKDDFWVKPQSSASYYKISADTVKSLRRELKDFRNRQIADFETNDVVVVDIDGKSFVKSANGFTEKDATEVQPHVQNLISDIAWSKAESFVDPGSDLEKLIGQPATHRILLSFDAKLNRAPLVLQAWQDPKDSGRFALMVGDSKTLLVVGKGVLANVKPTVPTGADLEEKPASDAIEQGS